MQRDTLNSLLPTGGLGQQTGVIPFHDECYDEGRARAEGARRGAVSGVSRAKEAFQAGRSLMKGEGAWARARVFQATRMAPGKDPHKVQGLPCTAGEREWKSHHLGPICHIEESGRCAKDVHPRKATPQGSGARLGVGVRRRVQSGSCCRKDCGQVRGASQGKERCR